jgi:hypothetical protein
VVGHRELKIVVKDVQRGIRIILGPGMKKTFTTQKIINRQRLDAV